MRYSAILAAPVLAGLALAQDDSQHTTTLTIGYTNSEGQPITTVTTYTYEYSNPATTLLTQTNSDGVITGAPSGVIASLVTSQPAVVTSQPEVATIPAGLPEGMTTITMAAASGTGYTSFTVSVGSSTTEVVGDVATATSSGSSSTGTGSSSGSDSDSDSSSSGSGSDSSASATSSGDASSSTESPGAAAGLAPAMGAVSFGALLAALL
ncbi:hypothetical protein F5Y15DRAFT_372256 [Xylariaceae sp. FL0016]|nr:hypothetical protein F5Y15DRAFT_372256 [Xylariaceae sp. FL0016]